MEEFDLLDETPPANETKECSCCIEVVPFVSGLVTGLYVVHEECSDTAFGLLTGLSAFLVLSFLSCQTGICKCCCCCCSAIRGGVYGILFCVSIACIQFVHLKNALIAATVFFGGAFAGNLYMTLSCSNP